MLLIWLKNLIKEFYEFLDDAIQHGGTVLCGGERLNYQGVETENGMFIRPTLVALEGDENIHNVKCVHEENLFLILWD